MSGAARVSLLDRLRSVLAAESSVAERAEAGDYTLPAHLLRRQVEEMAEFHASRPWRWLPEVPVWAFMLFGASDGFLRAVEADLRRWRRARRGERPYWATDARLAPREDDPEAVRRLLERVRRGEARARAGRGGATRRGRRVGLEGPLGVHAAAQRGGRGPGLRWPTTG